MKNAEKLIAVMLLLFTCGVVFFAAFQASYSFPVQDLAQYWCAAHLFPKNPYSMALSRQFEQAAGIYSIPLVTKTPPWALVLALPLRFLNYHLSFAAWTLISVLILTGCSIAVGRRAYRVPSLEPVVLPIVFGPALVLLMLGQFTVLLLLGAVLFCFLVEARRDWFAGVALFLILAKPHTPLLFLIVVAFWIVQARRWIVFISASLAFVSANLIAISLNPQIFSQFRERSLLVIHETESYPNLGGMLYSISGIHILALVPQIVGAVWVLFYWNKHFRTWNWHREGVFVLLVSVTCSYYSYPYDEILALPALITALAVGNRKAFIIPFVITELGYALYLSNIAGRFGFGYMFLWWTCLGWFSSVLFAQTRLFPPNNPRELSN